MTPPGQSEEAKAGEALIARLTHLYEQAAADCATWPPMLAGVGWPESVTAWRNGWLIAWPDVTAAIAALTRKVAEDEALLREARHIAEGYIEWCGGILHNQQCPEDDTCECEFPQRTNEWHRKLMVRLLDSRAGGGEAGVT